MLGSYSSNVPFKTVVTIDRGTLYSKEIKESVDFEKLTLYV
ncbi:hypothetical protein ACWN6Y_06550 [Vagococcus teuberi]|nr:hypothetical protein [Vagococcus teuberi]